MHQEFIQAELKSKGLTQSGLADKCRVSPSVIGRVIKGQATSYRLARYIARVLDRQVHDLWPQQYHGSARRRAA